MVKNYEEWRNNQLKDKNPDLKCLSDLLSAAQQFLSNSSSIATKGVFQEAIECSQKWIEEKNIEKNIDISNEGIVWTSGIPGEGEFKVYKNGQLAKHCFFKKKKLEGEFKQWHSNGQLFIHSFYKNGELNGEYKAWHKNGQLATYSFYKNDKLDGEYKLWYNNGKLYNHCFYKNDKIIRRIK